MNRGIRFKETEKSLETKKILLSLPEHRHNGMLGELAMKLEIFTIRVHDTRHFHPFYVTWFFRDEKMAMLFANEIIFSEGVIGRAEDHSSIYASRKHTVVKGIDREWKASTYPPYRAPNGMLFENAIAEETYDAEDLPF